MKADAHLRLSNYQRPTLHLPNSASHLLLHSCCAPCVGEVMQAVAKSGIKQTIIFYNPNIHPQEEYILRKDENKRYADQLSIPFVDLDYDTDNWFERVKGLENEPERGKRCDVCFDMRFERTALYAWEHNFTVFTSSLGISRWKDFAQINRGGLKAASRYAAMHYWTHNWRKQGGAIRMLEISKQEHFYQQEYCGCVYSLRDTNRWRMAHNRPRIERGVLFYGKDKHGE